MQQTANLLLAHCPFPGKLLGAYLRMVAALSAAAWCASSSPSCWASAYSEAQQGTDTGQQRQFQCELHLSSCGASAYSEAQQGTDTGCQR